MQRRDWKSRNITGNSAERQPTHRELVLMSESICKGYSWPASRLAAIHMAVLADVRAQTGKPISVLLAEAVQLAYGGCSSLIEK